MTTQTTTNQRKPLIKRIKPAGWLTIFVFALLFIGLAGLALRTLTAPIRSLPAEGATPDKAYATITLYHDPTKTPVPTISSPSVSGTTPLPAGWTQQTGLDGKPYLAPPADVQEQILNAFKNVVDCNYAEDAPDNVLLNHPDDKKTFCDRAQQSAVSTVTVSLTNIREITKLGPVNPIQCQNTNTCTVAQAKLGFFGAVMYDQSSCGSHYKNGGCLYRGTDTGGLEPYLILVASVTRQENGSWKVSNLDRQKLPGPPPSP